MAMLETNPYRVFYLINCPENTPDFRFIWGLDVDRTENSQTNRYTSIVATMKIPNDFSSVVVEAMDVTEYRMYNKELDTTSEQTSYKSYPPMPWNDIDDHIVELINNKYDKEDKDNCYGSRRKRQTDYADRIQALFEDPDNIKLTVDKYGNPKVEVKGLPYLYTVGKNDTVSVTIDSNPYKSDYTYTIDTGSDYYDPFTFNGSELSNYIYQSKRYDKARSTIEKLFGFDYYYDDEWDD